jgi:uncharacterized Tic20 family protein
MTGLMILTWAMILGGPIIWWILRRTTRAVDAADRGARRGLRGGLVLFILAGVVLLVSPVDSVANTAGIVIWMVAGALTVWATARRRQPLSRP